MEGVRRVSGDERILKVDYLARVEGEGSLFIKMKGDQLEDVKLSIFEPPRFFEAFLRGRPLEETPDITARICGICPVAYQMSSVHALEKALGITNWSEDMHLLRRLLYCGEWIESHLLHVFMLHLPDFLGFQDVIGIAQKEPELVKLGLKLKKSGNEIVRVIGGREIHPINVKVGGFYHLPTQVQLQKLKDLLASQIEDMYQVVRKMSQLHFPQLRRPYTFVALSSSQEYAMNQGIIKTSYESFSIEDYEDHFEESHANYTHALHSNYKERGEYLVGPLARFSLNYDLLSEGLKELVREIKLEIPCLNPFKSIVVRAIEATYAFEEAVRILEKLLSKFSKQSSIEISFAIPFKKGIGCHATEAPRGLLYHRYEVSEKGLIEEAKIVPPTSQNQRIIESDVREFVKNNWRLSDEDLTWKCEQAIRNYDPCISCATHFLKIKREVL
jgi:coenzyme F420-reducing hydrogenase alpha subunit